MTFRPFFKTTKDTLPKWRKTSTIVTVAWWQLWTIDKKTAEPTTSNEAAYQTDVH